MVIEGCESQQHEENSQYTLPSNELAQKSYGDDKAAQGAGNKIASSNILDDSLRIDTHEIDAAHLRFLKRGGTIVMVVCIF